ncbi:hypothetical protein KI387_008574, partial [Taxus chinensis]
MKIKFQGQEQVSPLESAVPDIGDSEVHHLDFGDFWARMTDANPSAMAQMIHDSGLAFAGGFPILVQCTDTVLNCGAHFSPDSSELTNVHGELILQRNGEVPQILDSVYCQHINPTRQRHSRGVEEIQTVDLKVGLKLGREHILKLVYAHISRGQAILDKSPNWKGVKASSIRILELQPSGHMGMITGSSAMAKPELLVLQKQVMTDEQIETLQKQIRAYSTICSQLVDMHKALSQQHASSLPSFLMGPHTLYDLGPAGFRQSARQRWTPSQIQLQILERLFEQGTATPNKQKIKEITMELSQHGQISETNVYNWFQNRKARAKRKQLHPQKEGESEIETDDEFPREKKFKPESDSNPQNGDSGLCDANAQFLQRNHGIAQIRQHISDPKQSGIQDNDSPSLLPSEDETKPHVSFGRTVHGVGVDPGNNFIQSLSEFKPIYSYNKEDGSDDAITQTSDVRRMFGNNVVSMESHGHMVPTNDIQATLLPLHASQSYPVL